MSVTIPIPIFEEFISLVQNRLESLATYFNHEAPALQILEEISEKAREIAGFQVRAVSSRDSNENESPGSQENPPEQSEIVHVIDGNPDSQLLTTQQNPREETARKVKRRRTRVSQKIAKVHLIYTITLKEITLKALFTSVTLEKKNQNLL